MPVTKLHMLFTKKIKYKKLSNTLRQKKVNSLYIGSVKKH